MTLPKNYDRDERTAAWLASRGEGCCEASGSPFHEGPCLVSLDVANEMVADRTPDRTAPDLDRLGDGEPDWERVGRVRAKLLDWAVGARGEIEMSQRIEAIDALDDLRRAARVAPALLRRLRLLEQVAEAARGPAERTRYANPHEVTSGIPARWEPTFPELVAVLRALDEAGGQ